MPCSVPEWPHETFSGQRSSLYEPMAACNVAMIITAAKRYAAFTAADIQAAFAKWLKVDDLAQVVLGPQPK